jgi:hypothetical protein
MKKIKVTLFSLVFIGMNVFGQGSPTSKGAFLSSISGNFASNIAIDDDAGMNNIIWSVNPEVNYMLIPNYFGFKIDANYKKITTIIDYHQFRINIGIVGLFYKEE